MGVPIRVLMADDHTVVRRSLKLLLALEPDLEVVGEAGCGDDAVRLASQLFPDVVLMDMMMPDIDGAAATERLLKQAPRAHVIVLAADDEVCMVVAAMRAGARGYLRKDVSEEELLRAIRAVARGEVCLSSGATEALVQQVHSPPRNESLTDRERDVMQAMVDGLTNKAIAERLGIGFKTVKTHVSNILAKLGCATRTEAVTAATRRNLVKPRSSR